MRVTERCEDRRTDRQTDRQADGQNYDPQDRASIVASRGKIASETMTLTSAALTNKQTCSQVQVQVQVQVFDSKSKSRESIMSMSQHNIHHSEL